jgi:hypothetical protein
MTAQVANGIADLMTLYDYDFFPAETMLGGQLSSRGVHQLRKILERLQYTSAPIKVQAAGQSELNALRVQAVAGQLLEWGVEVSPEQIVLVEVKNGISAWEAQEMHRTLLETVRLRGRTVRGGDSGGFSFGGFAGD